MTRLVAYAKFAKWHIDNVVYRLEFLPNRPERKQQEFYMRFFEKVSFDIPYLDNTIRVEVNQLNLVTIFLNDKQEFKKRFIRGGLKTQLQCFGRTFDFDITPLGFAISGVSCVVELDQQAYYEEELGFDKFGDASNFKIFRHGIWFYFDIGDDTIALHNSPGGTETLYLNDELIGEKRFHWKVNSVFNVVVRGSHYQVAIKVVSILKGVVDVQLIKDGLVIETQTGGLTYNERSAKETFKEQVKSFFSVLLTWMAIGFVIGFSIGIVSPL